MIKAHLVVDLTNNKNLVRTCRKTSTLTKIENPKPGAQINAHPNPKQKKMEKIKKRERVTWS